MWLAGESNRNTLANGVPESASELGGRYSTGPPMASCNWGFLMEHPLGRMCPPPAALLGLGMASLGVSTNTGGDHDTTARLPVWRKTYAAAWLQEPSSTRSRANGSVLPLAGAAGQDLAVCAPRMKLDP